MLVLLLVAASWSQLQAARISCCAASLASPQSISGDCAGGLWDAELQESSLLHARESSRR